jgi:hypothetical protein
VTPTAATRWIAIGALALSGWAADARAQVFARGAVIDPVTCEQDPTQSYALFLPSTYSHDRQWSLLLAFHPAARGRAMVEKYQAAAEQYGYIVAASNNSRNGPHASSIAAAQAMSTDVSRRFSIDPHRVYLAGMSGGARVATGIALASNNIAGVIASSAGYPDGKPRSSVPFSLFGTAGHEDFNYLEMRMLDRKLSSPHFLAVFEGGHTLPPDDVAFDALEWMELQAMQSGKRGRDASLANTILRKRRARVASATSETQSVYLLRALVADFKGLLDVSADSRQLEALSRQPEVKRALERERDADDAEDRMLAEIFQLEGMLGNAYRRDVSLRTLRDRLMTLSRTASAQAETPERSRARRVLRSITAGAPERVQDSEYLTLLDQFRLPRR